MNFPEALEHLRNCRRAQETDVSSLREEQKVINNDLRGKRKQREQAEDDEDDAQIEILNSDISSLLRERKILKGKISANTKMSGVFPNALTFAFEMFVDDHFKKICDEIKKKFKQEEGIPEDGQEIVFFTSMIKKFTTNTDTPPKSVVPMTLMPSEYGDQPVNTDILMEKINIARDKKKVPSRKYSLHF